MSTLIKREALWTVNTYSEFQIISLVITETLQNVKVFERRPRKLQVFSNTLGFLRKQPSQKSELLRKIKNITRLKVFNPFPNNKFFASSEFREFADDNYKFAENGRKFFKWTENTVGKGEIACYEQFLLFPVFSNNFYCRQSLFGKGIKYITSACAQKSYLANCRHTE